MDGLKSSSYKSNTLFNYVRKQIRRKRLGVTWLCVRVLSQDVVDLLGSTRMLTVLAHHYGQLQLQPGRRCCEEFCRIALVVICQKEKGIAFVLENRVVLWTSWRSETGWGMGGRMISVPTYTGNSSEPAVRAGKRAEAQWAVFYSTHAPGREIAPEHLSKTSPAAQPNNKF